MDPLLAAHDGVLFVRRWWKALGTWTRRTAAVEASEFELGLRH